MNWIRQIDVVLTSSKSGSKMTISSLLDTTNMMSIRVTGTKHLSVLQDEFAIEIDNLPYTTTAEIIGGEYYDVEIKAGYKSSNLFSVFKGGVLYVSNRYNSDRTYTCVILCTSKSVSKYGQKKLNLTLNSGLNAYNMVKILCQDAGMKKVYVDESLKNITLSEDTRVSSTITSFLEQWCSSKGYITNSDETVGNNEISIVNPEKTSLREYAISRDQIDVTGGYPTISSDGLEFSCLCSFNFSPCDVIHFDNSLIDLSVSNKSEVFKARTQFIDTNGEYIIYEVGYNLATRGSDFSCSIKARSKSIYSKILGGTSDE